jgi:uncharacterized protein YciI
MELFVLIGRDGTRGAELRRVHREAHLRNLAPLDDAGRVAYAGPLLDAEGAPIGSVIVFEADDLDAARRFAEHDPYVREGVFERWEVWGSRQVFPAATS